MLARAAGVEGTLGPSQHPAASRGSPHPLQAVSSPGLPENHVSWAVKAVAVAASAGAQECCRCGHGLAQEKG